ncbi:hypothetical protein KY358_05065 [Candidatus Woesearchaeota archaeon]|nr:hypothetical protein [Candidatus Woesearchaeota archaeon]
MGKAKSSNWIVQSVIIVMAVAAIGLIMIYGKAGKQPSADEIAGKGCMRDDDCGYSTIACESGTEERCKNECVYGRCVECSPVCIENIRCRGKVCLDSAKVCPDGEVKTCKNRCDESGECTKCIPICPIGCIDEACLESFKVCHDGTVASCANYCNPKTRECTVCPPICSVEASDDINFGTVTEGPVVDSIPCLNISYSKKEEVKVVLQSPEEVELPEGYSIVIDPFSVSQSGPLEMTLNIPEGYSDIRVLRCKKEGCSSLLVREVKELRCGGKKVREFISKEEFLSPEFMPIKVEEKSLSEENTQKIVSGKYSVEFSAEGLDAGLSMPDKNVREAENPGLKISGTPLIIRISSSIGEVVNATVTMPYIPSGGLEENSIGMYALGREGWEYIGGKISPEEKAVTAIVPDIRRYIDSKKELTLALMGVLCIHCDGPFLTKVYQPKEGSEKAVVLIHGFNPEANTFQELIDSIKLTNQPFEVWVFDYPSSKPIGENTKSLMSLMEENLKAYSSIDIVGHSLGGIIAQQALYLSYMENKMAKGKEEAYDYLSKVKEVVLIAASNEGSPVIEVYKNLFKSLVNSKRNVIFNPNSQVIEDLAKGIITPRIPDINYSVIAGTRSYEFNILLFNVKVEEIIDIYEKNDGLITVKSAQHVGDDYIDSLCVDYWEMNLTHNELIDDPSAIKVIGRIISKGIPKKDSAVLGYNQYFELDVSDNIAGDTYMIIGKKSAETEGIKDVACP